MPKHSSSNSSLRERLRRTTNRMKRLATMLTKSRQINQGLRRRNKMLRRTLKDRETSLSLAMAILQRLEKPATPTVGEILALHRRINPALVPPQGRASSIRLFNPEHLAPAPTAS